MLSVVDNLSTHRPKAVVERFGEQAGGWLWDRFTVHYTPKHGSWLNQAEIEISLFSRQCLEHFPYCCEPDKFAECRFYWEKRRRYPSPWIHL